MAGLLPCISITADDDVLHGMPRLEGTRISVLHIYDMAVRGGSDPAAVADALDITLGQVYTALAHYYDRPEELRRYRADAAAAREELRERVVESPATVDAADE